MGNQGSFKAAAPSRQSLLAAAAAVMSSSSFTYTPTLSAMAAPFVPVQAQQYHAPHPVILQHAYHALQPVLLQQPFLHQHPMMPYQMPPGQMNAQFFHSTLPRPHQTKYVNASLLKKHNRTLSEQKERMYQEWMLAQHHRAHPPVSVSRKPSIVLPEGDYIGYYFKPKSDYVGYYMKDKTATTDMECTQQMSKDDVATTEGQAHQMAKEDSATQEAPAHQMPKEEVATQDHRMSKERAATHEGPTQQVAVAMQEVVISPGGDVDYRVIRQGLTSFLPLLPLDGPIIRQTKLEGDYNRHKEPTINTSDDYNGGFLPLLEPVRQPVPFNRESEPTEEKSISYTTKDSCADAADHDYQGVRKENVAYSYATVRRRKL